MPSPRSLLATLAVASLALLTTGCSTSFEPANAPDQVAVGSIVGRVHGGNQPISGAHVYIFAAATTGYGGSGIAASASNASTSLMNSVTTGSFPTAYDSTLKAYYVTTKSDGSFGLGGNYTCTSGQQVYLYVLGGNPGSGTNSASGMLAVLGQCPTTGGSLAATVPFVWVNEVSTVAAAYALAGFATDATHIGSSGTALAQVGIANAFANAANIVTIANGVALATTPAGNGTVDQAKINLVANSLAACVNSTGPTSSTCSTLLNTALLNGSTGASPTDTASAAINIAHYPINGLTTIYGLPSGIGAPFQPTFASAPHDLLIGVTYTGGGLNTPLRLAIDGLGNAWVASYNGTSKFSPLGVALSGSVSGFTGINTTWGNGIAVDTSNNVWVYSNQGLEKLTNAGVLSIGPISAIGIGNGMAIDQGGNVWSSTGNGTLSKSSSSGTVLNSSIATGSTSLTFSLAVDASNNIWAASYGDSTVRKVSNSGTILSGGSGYTGGGINSPNAVAIDGSGNAWVSNESGTVISKLSSAGAPVSSTGYSSATQAISLSSAIDGAGNVWICDLSNTITEFSGSGAVLTGSYGYAPDNANRTIGISIDSSGNAWVINNNGNSLTQLLGLATPVVTPIAAAVAISTFAIRP